MCFNHKLFPRPILSALLPSIACKLCLLQWAQKLLKISFFFIVYMRDLFRRAWYHIFFYFFQMLSGSGGRRKHVHDWLWWKFSNNCWTKGRALIGPPRTGRRVTANQEPRSCRRNLRPKFYFLCYFIFSSIATFWEHLSTELLKRT